MTTPRHIFAYLPKLRGAWYNGNCQVHLLMISLEEGRCVQLICKVHLKFSDQIVRTRHFLHNYTTTWLVVSWSSDCKCLRKAPIYANSKEKSYISVNKLFCDAHLYSSTDSYAECIPQCIKMIRSLLCCWGRREWVISLEGQGSLCMGPLMKANKPL